MLAPAARLHIPQWQPDAPDEHADNIRAIERSFNDLPIHAAYFINTGPLTSWTSTSSTDVPWAAVSGESQAKLTWTKHHHWSDAFVQISLSQQAVGGDLQCVFDLATIPLMEKLAGGTGFGRIYLAHAIFVQNIYNQISAMGVITDLRAGTYYSEIQARRSANTMSVDGNCFGQLYIQEIPPIA